MDIPNALNSPTQSPVTNSLASNTPLPSAQLSSNIEIIDIGAGRGLPSAYNAPVYNNDIQNENDIIDRRRLILKIKEYKQLLSHKLNGLNLDSLDTLSIDALEDLLKDIEFTVGVSSSAATLKAMSEGTFNAVGGMFNTPGLGTALCMNPEYVDTIHEVGIKYSSYIYQDPLLRLGLIVSQTAAVLYQMNRNQEMAKLGSTPVSSIYTEKFNSL